MRFKHCGRWIQWPDKAFMVRCPVCRMAFLPLSKEEYVRSMEGT